MTSPQAAIALRWITEHPGDRRIEVLRQNPEIKDSMIRSLIERGQVISLKVKGYSHLFPAEVAEIPGLQKQLKRAIAIKGERTGSELSEVAPEVSYPDLMFNLRLLEVRGKIKSHGDRFWPICRPSRSASATQRYTPKTAIAWRCHGCRQVRGIHSVDAQGHAYCEPCGDRLSRFHGKELSRDLSDLQARIWGQGAC